MPVAAAQLNACLERDLPGVILVFGAEPLLVEETCDLVRARAAALGYAERLVLTVEPRFDWNRLAATASNMSLFAARRLIDLRLPTGKPGDAGAAALVEFCSHRPTDIALLIVCGRVDASTRHSKWFKAVEAAGVAVEHKAVEPAQLGAWITARLARKGLRIDGDAAALLAYYLEGNLLAAAQEIDRLALLLAGRDVVHYDDVADSIADNARFDAYTLADHCAAGNAARALRSLCGLRQAGVEPALIVWVLANQVRTLYRLAAALEAGRARAEVYRAFRIWPKKAPAFNAALARRGRREWAGSLRSMAHLDRVLKGRESEDIWYALERACLAVCGFPSLKENART